MKRIAFVFITSALLMAVLVIIFTAGLNPQFPPEGRALLDEYLSPSEEAAVQVISLAGNPEKLAQNMVDRLDGVQEHQDMDMGSSEDESVLKPVLEGSLRFPPQEVWCILLDRGAETAGDILFVTRHENLYGSQWAFYRGLDRAFSPSNTQALDAIDCHDVILASG